jgi:hypothetical protein
MNEKQTTYRYFLTHRPPGIGCQPEGDLARETWVPRREIPNGEAVAFGSVTYGAPLTWEQLWKYELLPEEEVERLLYYLWQELGRDEATTHDWWQLDDYWECPLPALEDLAGRRGGDPFARIVLGLKDRNLALEDVKRWIEQGSYDGE